MFMSLGHLGVGFRYALALSALGLERVDSKTYQRSRVQGSGSRVQSFGLRSKAQQKLHVGKGRDT